MIKQFPILKTIDLNLCVSCKSVKLSCGLSKCPLVQPYDLNAKVSAKISKIGETNSIFGPTPQIFVGSFGYPYVQTGPMTALFPDEMDITSNPSDWVNLEMNEIIEQRFGLLRGKQKTNVDFRKERKSTNITDKLADLAKSITPVEIEGKFIKRPIFDPKINSETQPMGPSGELSKFSLTSNPNIPRRIDSVLDDELNSVQQISLLYEDGFDIYYLQNIMSSGLTGLSSRAKLVPTRWSITATDDTLGKNLISGFKDYPTVDRIMKFSGSFLGNYFTVCLFPGNWQFENFESWLPGSIFTLTSSTISTSVSREGFRPKEYYKGRIGYSEQAGGYYASRLAILEKLHELRRQARVIIFREITSEYSVPVGVWAVREGVKLCLESQALSYTSQMELFDDIQKTIKVPFKSYRLKSEIINQRSLNDYF